VRLGRCRAGNHRFVALQEHQGDGAHEFPAEGFNILNQTNFDSIDTGVASPIFGLVLSTREPRIIQIGLKFNF